MGEPLEEIATTLQGIQLPALSRPALGPNDPPTLELVQFDLKAYAYSSIAYVRDLLNGLLYAQGSTERRRGGSSCSRALRMDYACELRLTNGIESRSRQGDFVECRRSWTHPRRATAG